MSFRRFVTGVTLAYLLVCLTGGSVFAQDSHGEGATAVAEVEPGHEGHDHAPGEHAAVEGDGHDHAGDAGHGDAHGAHDPLHNEFEAALHGNATPQTSAVTGQDNPAEIKWDLAFWTLVVFGCLTAVLWKYAWGPIRDALDARERSVQQNIDAAKEQNEKAAALLADHEARLASSADEVRKILDDARSEAEVQKQSIIADAQTAATAEKDRAVMEIHAAKNGALRELAEKSVDTAVGMAGKIVQRQLTSEDHSSLIAEAIKHFPSNN